MTATFASGHWVDKMQHYSPMKTYPFPKFKGHNAIVFCMDDEDGFFNSSNAEKQIRTCEKLYTNFI